MRKSTENRIGIYLLLVLFTYSGFVALYAYETQYNAQNVGATVECADEAEACSDAVEDINGGELEGFKWSK